ncbi:hypothetical protein OF83DRAFT_515504 [Amylostereum chailletii]|nr:hypothetical protein OF83DRAFT_515504 [Amylostereum chailletii]
MSSPGPSHPPPHPHPSSSTPSARPKQKLPAQGITAGAEDAKYRAKYHELKKKVKEIESDNDKLHAKTLQAKRNIQRMRIERAVLYERLSHPPSPRAAEPHPVHSAPVHHYGPPAPHAPPRGHYRDPPEPSMVVVDPNDLAAVDHYRSLGGNIRRIVGPDGHHIHVVEMPAVPGQHSASVPASTHTSRHSTHPDARHSHVHAQPFNSHHAEPPRAPDHRRSHSNSYRHSPSGSQAHAHSHPHSRSHSRSRSRTTHPSTHPPPAAGYPPESPMETPTYHDPRGEYVPSERRSHRGDDYPPPPSHMQAPVPRGHTPPYGAHSPPPSPRGSSRGIHNHQRLGPGTNINNIGQPERERDRDIRDRDRVQEWERERDRRLRDREEMGARAPTPPFASRTRSGVDERDAYAARAYESRAYPEEATNGGGHGGSRSLTPHSRSRSGSAMAYPAEEHARYYEREYEPRASTSRYTQSGPSDVDTRLPAEDIRRAHSTSDARATDGYSDIRRGRSDVGSDVDMEDAPRRERGDS